MTEKTELTAESIKADRARAEAQKKTDAANDKPKAEAKKTTGEVKTYTSTSPAFVGAYIKPGELIVTDAPPGEDWTEVSPKEAAAIQASTDTVPDDANLEEASVDALQAVAIIKHVPITGIAKDKDALITAIKAAYEPKL